MNRNQFQLANNVLNEHPWALTSSAFDSMRDLIRCIESGGAIPQREAETEPFLVDVVGGRTRRSEYSADTRRTNDAATKSVLVIPFAGTIFPRGSNDLMRFIGGVSLQETMASLRRAVRDPGIGSIIGDFDSPGGMVAGVPEAAAEIRALRGLKPMSAIANFQCASAAYFLASAFDEVVASSSSSVGSIGVIAQYFSASKALENEGYAVQTMRWPDKKAEADGILPLSDEAVAYRMRQIRNTYDDFLEGLVRGRRRPRSLIEERFGQGRSLDALSALKAGMVDRVLTFDALLNEHTNGRAHRGTAFESVRRRPSDRAIETAPLRTVADLQRRWGLGN